MLTPDIIHKLWTISEKRVPHEACGVIVGDDQGFYEVYECVNYAPKPQHEFWMNPKDLAYYRRHFLEVMLWHSHPNDRWTASALDKRIMIQVDLPMAIVAWRPCESVSVYGFHGQEIVTKVRYDREGRRLESTSNREDAQREGVPAHSVQPGPVA